MLELHHAFTKLHASLEHNRVVWRDSAELIFYGIWDSYLNERGPVEQLYLLGKVVHCDPLMLFGVNAEHYSLLWRSDFYVQDFSSVELFG